MIPPAVDQRFVTLHRRLRVVWTVVSIFLVEIVVLGVSAVPAVALWTRGTAFTAVPEWARVLFLAMLAVPSYLVFALSVLALSAASTRILGWRTQPNLSARLSDYEWPVLNWGRYLMSIHVARMFAGAVCLSTPVWGLYMRWNGAHIGHGVWVNSLGLMDHNLLTFGDGVVIGADARVSGHTVENGMLKTAPVRVGRGSTIGIGSVVGIGTEIGEHTQIGALSVVPKFSVLESHAVYAGAPVHRLHTNDVAGGGTDAPTFHETF